MDRWMLFVDGENVLYRGRDFAKTKGFELQVGHCYQHDAFLWMPNTKPGLRWGNMVPLMEEGAQRSMYYTSVCGDDSKLDTVRQQLWAMHFEPHVFKKARQQDKAKGVDVSMTRDLLTHAFRDNYDVAAIVTGDTDYIPVIEELKRMGKRVQIRFFESYLPMSLRLASDNFFDIEGHFMHAWRNQASSAHIGLR